MKGEELEIFSSPKAYMKTRTSLHSVLCRRPLCVEASRNLPNYPGLYEEKSSISEFQKSSESPKAYMKTRTSLHSVLRPLPLHREGPRNLIWGEELGIFLSLRGAQNFSKSQSIYDDSHLTSLRVSPTVSLQRGSSKFYHIQQTLYKGRARNFIKSLSICDDSLRGSL